MSVVFIIRLEFLVDDVPGIPSEYGMIAEVQLLAEISIKPMLIS